MYPVYGITFRCIVTVHSEYRIVADGVPNDFNRNDNHRDPPKHCSTLDSRTLLTCRGWRHQRTKIRYTKVVKHSPYDCTAPTRVSREYTAIRGVRDFGKYFFTTALRYSSELYSRQTSIPGVLQLILHDTSIRAGREPHTCRCRFAGRYFCRAPAKRNKNTRFYVLCILQYYYCRINIILRWRSSTCYRLSAPHWEEAKRGSRDTADNASKRTGRREDKV